MSESRHARLEDVVLDESFVEVDLALRRGRHIDRDDGAWYAFVTDAQDHLELFYRRYGCELVHRAEGYFYLLPTSERLGRRHLSPIDMLVGQALTLLYLDPATVESGGVVTRDQLLGHLAGVMGTDALVRSMNPKRKKQDPRVAEETARNKVFESVRRLASLGFVEALDEVSLRLRPSLMRFAEPVRGTAAPEAEMEKLVAAGEIILTDPEKDDDDEHDAADDETSGEEAPSLEAADEIEPEPEPEPEPHLLDGDPDAEDGVPLEDEDPELEALEAQFRRSRSVAPPDEPDDPEEPR